MIKLRFAREDDLEQILSIKSKLTLSSNNNDISRGGFLLGSTWEQYLFFVQKALVIVLEDVERHTLAGFAIGIPDQILRHTDLWQRKDNIQWLDPARENLENFKLGYFEQLAILPVPAYRFYAPNLALAMVKVLFDQHDYILTTVVYKPVQNLASISLLQKIGAQCLGYIEEEYPVIGRITSQIYCFDHIAFKHFKIENPKYLVRIAA